ncbi:unnamed protein product [Clavelina lepadiformis]|uniref:Uncharacterized protein n=1 Tax=Clavelina lepadiformis TaxID=159417 RepID=A0ABP0GRP5_CLALP
MKINYALLLLALSVVTELSGSVSTLPFISDVELTERKLQGYAFGVLPMHQSSIIKDTLVELSPNLNDLGINIFILDCREFNSGLCSEQNRYEQLFLFKNGSQTSISAVHLLTKVHAEGHILSWLQADVFVRISSEQEWNDLKETSLETANIVMAYTRGPGNKLHDFLTKASIKSQSLVKFAYTTDIELTKTLFPGDETDERGTIWFSFCLYDISGSACNTVKYQFTPLRAAVLSAMLKQLPHPNTLVIEGPNASGLLVKSLSNVTRDNLDAIVLVSSPEKLHKTVQIAKAACTNNVGKAHCFVVNGNVDVVGISEYVEENRIRLLLLAAEGRKHDIDVGYLFAETSDEIIYHWYRIELARNFYQMRVGDTSADFLANIADRDDHLRLAYDQQDDPIAYAVHTNKALKDLYLFDFKTIPRLSYVKYNEVIASNNYAVILFTLEFNAKSSAVLSTFSRIHNNYVSKGQKSPLYRVECFDWPDICARAGFETYPAMVLYRSNEQHDPYIYNDVWSEKTMEKVIWLYSTPWPVIAETITDVQQLLNLDYDCVYGLISTQAGEKVFKKVAALHGKRFLFVSARGAAASYIETSLTKKHILEQKDIVLARSRGRFVRNNAFSTDKELEDFLVRAFENDMMQELTASNFQQILNGATSLFVQYKNLSSAADPSIDKLSDILLQLEKEFREKATFVWLDISPGTPGEYIFRMHENGKDMKAPLGFIKQQDVVSIQSFDGVDDESLVSEWIRLCLSGKSQVSYKFQQVDWQPPLSGHNFLRYMMDDGSLPEDYRSFKGSKEDLSEATRSLFSGILFHREQTTKNDKESNNSKTKGTLFVHSEL